MLDLRSNLPGVQQGLRCRGKGCKEHLGRALVSGLAGMPLPSADGVAWFRGSVSG